MAPAWGIGLLSDMRGGSEHRFIFEYALGIRALVCFRRLALASNTISLRGFALASGIQFGLGRFVWTFGKALQMEECAIILGSCSLRESRETSGNTVRSA